MAGLIQKYYDLYKSQIITFNQKIILELGLQSDQISFKLGELKIPSILFSTSMEEARLMAYLDKNFFKYMQKRNTRIALNLCFQTQDKRKKVNFFIHSNIVNLNKYECDKPDLFMIQVRFLNQPSDFLIQTLGKHLEEKATEQKRMEQRIELKSEDDKLLGIDSMQNILFNAGKGTKCILTEISIFSAKIIIKGKTNEFTTQSKVMLVMQAKGLDGIGEMMGHIERVDPINPQEGIYSLIITFDQESIPPSYKMWIAQCIEIITLR